MPTSATRRRWIGVIAVAALVCIALVAGLVVWIDRGLVPFLQSQRCRAEVGEVTVKLTTEQAENAALISAVAVRRGLPARAASIALATAMQESKLRNLDHGDRDSVGLFQQRPSQGWGTAEQIQDPYYAANAFYDGLEKIDGYQRMRITEAAQQVQRSGFPEAYEDHAADARALASALTGYSPARFRCTVAEPATDEQAEQANGLTPRADRVRTDLEQAFGDLPLGGFAPGGVSAGHRTGSSHYAGRAIDVFVRPIGPANRRRGWAIASYVVANAARLDVSYVIFDDRIWSAGHGSDDGWRDYTPPARSGDRRILEHREHVHVDVA